jgi:ParB-like chromosome segregation protein Spo0J
MDQIAASMVEFGWTNPVLVDEQGGLPAGCSRPESSAWPMCT